MNTISAVSIEGIALDYRPPVERSMPFRRRGRSEPDRIVRALDGVSFDIAKGSAFGIIGPNGAGKSTLMRVLAGTLLPDAGTVAINGRLSTLLSLGVGFNAELSGRRNIVLGGLASGLSKADMVDRTDDIIAFAELEDSIDRPIRTYSSGMLSRLAFSIGMHLDPDILLLDEVFSVGDESFRLKSMAAISDLLSRSGTVVLVSHQLASVSSLCDTVVWMEAGKVREVGGGRAVVNAYRREALGAPALGNRADTTRAWTANQKTELVLELLAGTPLSELSLEFGIEETRIVAWRNEFVAAGRDNFKVDP